MANNIKTELVTIANSVLLNVQRANIWLQHSNMSYNDQFREEPIGRRGSAVEITVLEDQEPADIFVDTIKISDYSEGSVQLVLDTILDKSFKFTVREEYFNYGAVDRATQAGSKSVVDKAEILFLKELFINAKVFATPSGTIENNKDLAIIEKAAIDMAIPDSERVVFINSTTKANLASNTNLFAYARDGADLYTDGMGTGNNDFENGTGFALKIFGLNVFVSSKNTPEYLEKYVLGDIKSGTTYIDTATAKVVNDQLVLSVAANDAFVIKAGSILKIGSVLVKVTADVNVSAGAARDVAVQTNTNPEDLVKVVDGTEAELEDVTAYTSVLFSNKAVGFAMKALDVDSEARQAISNDDATGMSLRITKDYDITHKATIVSVDALVGFKALTDKIAVFK